MCYSALVAAAMRKTEKEYAATLNFASFVELYRQRAREPKLKIPAGRVTNVWRNL